MDRAESEGYVDVVLCNVSQIANCGDMTAMVLDEILDQDAYVPT
jgi:hypothetical protein